MNNNDDTKIQSDMTYTYINTIDEFINNIFDILNNILSSKQNELLKYLHNIIKKKTIIDIEPIIKLINLIITDVNKKISQDWATINKYLIGKNKEHILQIIDNYIYIYIFIYLSYFIDIKIIRYLLIKIKKINNYELNANNIAMIINYSELIKDILLIVDNIDNIKKIQTLSFYNAEQVITFMNSVGIEFIKEHFMKSNNKYQHNILKNIIFKKIYIYQDKINIFKLIEQSELEQSEFIYIHIIDSIIDEIDYSTIENLFISGNYKHNIAEFMYDMLINYENEITTQLQTDTKINQLFEKNILIPITDEFLRYHKDIESYDKNVGTSKIITTEKVAQKNNTKIKYIVTKINQVIDLNSVSHKKNNLVQTEINKLFYPSMLYRKAVIINEIEELQIINKLLKQGKQTISNNEYYSELISFRTYPYLNFKDFSNYGFSFKPTETITTIRNCNFEYKNELTYPTQYNNYLQIRTASSNNTVNIVGVAINPNALINTYRHLDIFTCIKLNNTYQINEKQQNGYIHTIKLLKEQLLHDLNYKLLLYWIFDKKYDKITLNKYENLSQLNFEEYFKYLLSNIYDELIVITYEKIINIINVEKSLNLFKINNIIRNISNQLLDITTTSYYNDILLYSYQSKLKKNNILLYDINENIIPGLNKELIKIPTYIDTQTTQPIIVIKKHDFLIGKKEEEENPLLETALCQHQLTWNVILMYKKKDPNKFIQQLYEFIKKYVIENKDNEYICKSCFQYVDINKYIYDTFDSDISNVAISVSLEADLENIFEYEKYTKGIKNMDKMIERIAYISNMQFLLGNDITNKHKRQNIIKNTIDLITVQLSNYDLSNVHMRKERLESVHKLYGINKELSIYFVFPMDNSIFSFSSTDIDKFKRYKYNNIIAYFVFLMLCDITNINIMQFNYDKLLNYEIFDKHAIKLFDGLLIRINNSNDIKPITNYKLLCFVIYYLSTMIIKFNFWFFDNQKLKSKKNTIHPVLQQTVIHTIVDLINSILEINTRKTKNYIYEYIATKFFIKLHKLYDNNSSVDVIKHIYSILNKSTNISNNIIKHKKTLIITNDNSSTYGNKQIKTHLAYYNVKSLIPDYNIIYYIGIDNVNNIFKKYYTDTLEKIYKYYDLFGNKRMHPLLSIESNNLEKDVKTISKIIYSKYNQYSNYNDHLNKIVLSNVDYATNYKTKFDKINIVDVVDTLIKSMEKIIGVDININNNNIYLKKTVYIIDHDYLGHTKTTKTILFDSDNIIKFIKNDTFLKMDIYQYFDKSQNIYIYYHGTQLFLLGYKHVNNEYTAVSSNCYLKINHSIQHNLLLLGHSHLNYTIDSTNSITNITDIIRQRITNLKNCIKEFQTIVYQLKNKYTQFTNSSTHLLLKQFKNKFINLNYYLDGERIFAEWKDIIDSIYVIPLKSNSNIELDANTLSATKFIKYNNSDNMLLYYLCSQIQQFININAEPSNQSKLIIFISSIINVLSEQYLLNDTIFRNNEIKKFNLLLTNFVSVSHCSADDCIDNSTSSTLSDDAITAIANENEDMKEQLDAIDIDLELDADITDDSDDGMLMIREADD